MSLPDMGLERIRLMPGGRFRTQGSGESFAP